MFKKIVLLFSFCLSLSSEANELRFSPEDQDLYLATKFLKTAFEDKKDNFVVSPLSVYAATALLANGAQGESLKEIGNIMGVFNRNDELIGLDVPSVTQALQSYMSQKKQFEINNSIWGNDFKPEYQEKMKNELFSEAKPLPHNTLVINEWIKEKTKGRIPHLLNEEKLEKGGRLFLVNTVYFKDEWETVFDEYGTRVHDFHSLDGQLDKVDMMARDAMIDYYQDDQMQSVRLPYKNGDVMYIFLPKEGVDFHEFIQNLEAGDLYLRYYNVPVSLQLPKFNLDYKIEDVPKFFEKWGIHKVFNPAAAELGGLSDKPYYVGKIIHQANIGVNEKGTEASAATVMDLLGFAPGQARELHRRSWSIPFIADRPFIFMINNGDFIGVYTKGSSELYAKRLAEEEQARQEAEEHEIQAEGMPKNEEIIEGVYDIEAE